MDRQCNRYSNLYIATPVPISWIVEVVQSKFGSLCENISKN
jgi:hypothetical protein